MTRPRRPRSKSSPMKPASLRMATALLLSSSLLAAVACERLESETAKVGDEAAVTPSTDRSVSLDGNAIETRIDREQVLVGDPIRLIVVATPAADRVAEIELPGETLGAFDVVELPSPRDASLLSGSKAVALELSTFESGTVEIPPIRARFEPRGGGVEIELASDPIAIVVESVLVDGELAPGGGESSAIETGVDPSALREIKGVVAMDDGRSEAWWWLASLGAMVALVLGGFLLLRRRGPAPEPPPGPWAIEQFSRLAGECRSRDAIASTWEESAAVLRGYLVRACGIPATDLTSREILDAIEREPRFGDSMRMTIAGFLRQADLVKFAGASADRDASARTIEALRDLVAVLEATPTTASTGGAS